MVVVGVIVLLPQAVSAVPAALQQEPAVVINEVQVDPASGPDGDANGDGIRDTYEDEFIELVNRGSDPVDISGFQLGAAGAEMYVFEAGTTLAPGQYVAVFGGGDPANLPGPVFTAGGRLGSGLTNTSGRLLLIDPAGPDTLQDISYEGWDADGAFARVPEGWGGFIEHLLIDGRRFSPASPALSGGGPDQSKPTVYRIRVVNLTSAGYQVAWRTSLPADARVEIERGGSIRHQFDSAPAGLLHLAGIYGMDPLTPIGWRAVSSGTVAPSDSFESLATGSVVISVPYAVYGSVVDESSGDPMADAHVFLRAQSSAGPSGWLAAVTDSLGMWNLNLGNLRSTSGGSYPWSTGDTLMVDIDGGSQGVASAEVLVDGFSPQQIVSGGVEPDSPPLFAWEGLSARSTADTSIVLGYSLSDVGDSWALVYLRLDGQSEKILANTDPGLLSEEINGSVILTVSSLAEGTLWWISALVEDGLNPPFWVDEAEPLRISHSVVNTFQIPAGVTMFTPTLDDPGLSSAYDWLGKLPSSGELSRWDLPTAQWMSASRQIDGTVSGGDFQLLTGEGYALVSVQAGSLQISGPRRYSLPVLQAGIGLALFGVSDSTTVRSADGVLSDISVRAVSRWDLHSQSWSGRFRLPDGNLVGDDFLVKWGDAIAVDLDSTTTWQPSGSFRSSITTAPMQSARSLTPVSGRYENRSLSLLASSADRGCVDIYWRAPAGAFLELESNQGNRIWRTTNMTPGEWILERVTGLEPGEYSVLLNLPGPEGEKRLAKIVEVGKAATPSLPVWLWGAAPDNRGPLLLEYGEHWIHLNVGPEGVWYTSVDEQVVGTAGTVGQLVLVELGSDGGWRRWPLSLETVEGTRIAFRTDGAPLALSGVDVEKEGPLSLMVHWQVLDGEEPLTFQIYLGYETVRGGGGPPGDPGQWVPEGEQSSWQPGEPPVLSKRIPISHGPQGQLYPCAVAIRVETAGGMIYWLGPAALPVSEAEDDLMLLPAVPNPFNPETMLRYSIPPGEIGSVRMEIRDVRGRLVKILVDSQQAPGSYMVRWDGRDSSGRNAAAGIYLVLLEVNNRRLTRKIMLLR